MWDKMSHNDSFFQTSAPHQLGEGSHSITPMGVGGHPVSRLHLGRGYDIFGIPGIAGNAGDTNSLLKNPGSLRLIA